MRFEYSVLSILAAFAAVQAQDIDNDDVPFPCRSLCDQAVLVSDRCDAQTDGSRAFLDCFCNDGVAQSLPDCEACVNFYDDDNDNDVNDLRTSCGLPTATYNPSSATSEAGPTTTAASQPTTSAAQPTPTSGATTSANPTSSVVSSVSSQVATSSPTSFTGAAAAATAAPVGAVAAAVFGLAQLL